MVARSSPLGGPRGDGPVARGAPGHDAQLRLSARPHGHDGEVPVGVDADDALARAGDEDRRPLLRPRAPDRGDGDLEVGAVGVVDDEQVVAGGFDRVVQARPAAAHEDRRSLDVGGVEEPHLGRRARGRVDDDPAAVAGRVVTGVKTLVVLLEEKAVPVRGGADAVGPHLPCAPRLVHPGVDDRRGVRRPREPVAESGDGVVDDVARLDVEDSQAEVLVADEVDADRPEFAVRGRGESARREVLFALGQEVAVPHGLCGLHVEVLGTAADMVGAVGAVHRDPEDGRILLSLPGAGEVPPVALPHEHARVVFTGAGSELAHDGLAEGGEVGGPLFGPSVLGFQQLDELGAFLVAHPLVIVHVGVSVEGALCRDFSCNRCRHTHSLPSRIERTRDSTGILFPMNEPLAVHPWADIGDAGSHTSAPSRDRPPRRR